MNWLGPDQPEGEPVPGPLAEQAVRLALVHRAQQPDTRDPRTGHTLEQSLAIRVRWRAAVRTIDRLLRLRQRWAALGRLLQAVPSNLWSGLERQDGVLVRVQAVGSWQVDPAQIVEPGWPGVAAAADDRARRRGLARRPPAFPGPRGREGTGPAGAGSSSSSASSSSQPPASRYHTPFQGLPRPPPPPRNGDPSR